MEKPIKLLLPGLLIFFLFKLLLSPQSVTKQHGKNGSDAALVVWDVGQGQWISLVTPTRCFHYDMGGEFFPKGLDEKCFRKINEISLTHWDMDHVSFLFRFKARGFRLCMRRLPQGEHRWKKAISKWPRCQTALKNQEVFTPSQVSRRRNENSQAFLLFRQILITGDAPAKEERKIHFPSGIKDVRLLVVGHHGSRTSSSRSFLNGLRNLKQAVASARFEKYRHPHPQVTARLKQRKVPLVSTNDWGNLMIEF